MRPAAGRSAARDEVRDKARLPIDESAESMELCAPRGLDGDGGGAGSLAVAVRRQVAPNMAHVSLRIPETDLRLDRSTPALSAAQAVCIEALRKGASSKSQIAIAAGLSHYKTRSALLSLAGLRLAESAAGNRWRLTRRGRACRFRTVPERSGRGAGKLGRASKRALRALDRPMSGSELADRLGVTKQRAYQLIVDLHAVGRVRLADPPHRLRIVARVDDPTPFLSRQEQRVLSAIPEDYATTAAKIRLAAGCGETAAAGAIERLLALGLVARERKVAGAQVYRLKEAGTAHPQYRRAAGPAAPPSLPVRSDRVCAVLALLAKREQAQITEVRDALDIEHRSINALFQYLKRKALVRKDGQELRSPYVLTPQGREILAEMQRRRAA
jgi:DNA-binding MarR family transcriptional regulator